MGRWAVGQCPLWVKSGKARVEHLLSALRRKADISENPSSCPLSANRRQSASHQNTRHSINSSARASTPGGNFNLVGALFS
jgi:hypothetical protein